MSNEVLSLVLLVVLLYGFPVLVLLLVLSLVELLLLRPLLLLLLLESDVTSNEALTATYSLK
jgi:hypothetical protein